MVPGFWALVTISVVNGILLLVSYISNNTFPQPLSEEEEAKYLDLLAQGDEEARSVLTERNLRLVAHIVKMICTENKVILVGSYSLIKLAFR